MAHSPSETILVTTTDGVQDHKVIAHLGIVSGEAIMGTNLFKDFFCVDPRRRRRPRRGV